MHDLTPFLAGLGILLLYLGGAAFIGNVLQAAHRRHPRYEEQTGAPEGIVRHFMERDRG